MNSLWPKLKMIKAAQEAVGPNSRCNYFPQISEMSQEPRPVSRDCIYPALVGCSAPVEAVLPQISSNMWSVKGNVLHLFKHFFWNLNNQLHLLVTAVDSPHRSRGFGQLVRARNIKTVGDLSALTPSEIKTLPIRSPKISNVKKALKIYEQQVCQGKEGSDRIEVTLQTNDKLYRNI